MNTAIRKIILFSVMKMAEQKFVRLIIAFEN
jgi:hypothetical protein